LLILILNAASQNYQIKPFFLEKLVLLGLHEIGITQ